MYTKYMGVLVPSTGGVPDWAKAEVIYQSDELKEHNYPAKELNNPAIATQSGWLSIEYTTSPVVQNKPSKLIIDGNTVFLDSRKPTNNTYEAYFSYLIPIADRSKWTISIYGRAVAVKFIPPRIERKI